MSIRANRFKGRLLEVVSTAVEKRAVDKNLLMEITLGVVVCKLVMRFFSWMKGRLQWPLRSSLKQHFATHLFEARARLDLPTFDDEIVQSQLEAASSGPGRLGIAWTTLSMVLGVFSTAVQLVSQASVLWQTLSSQRDGHLLATVGLIQSLAEVAQWKHRGALRDGGMSHSFFDGQDEKESNLLPAWAATTKNHDYIKLQGLKRLVAYPEHRKEFVAGNLAKFTTACESFAEMLHPADNSRPC